jgi:hypothetical protein
MGEHVRRIFLCMFTETEVVVFQTTASTVLPRFTNTDHSDNIYQRIHNVALQNICHTRPFRIPIDNKADMCCL